MDSSSSKKFTEQEKKIKKYEEKMRDLIEAYKTLSKEKEALEMTIKSLVENSSNVKSASLESDCEKVNNQVVTLSNAIATLNEEKRKMERNYLEDKRVTRSEYEANLVAMRRELESQGIVNRELSSQLAAARSDVARTQTGVMQEMRCLEQENAEIQQRLKEARQQIDEYRLIIDRLNSDCERYRSVRSDLENEMIKMDAASESRVAFLEGVISDLSKSFGKMEQQHLADQDTINKLLDKSKNDSRDCPGRKETQSDTPDILQFSQLDLEQSLETASISSIVEKISQLRSQLLKLDPSFDLSTVSPQHLSLSAESCCHSNCVKGNNDSCCNQQLKEQLDKSQATIQNLQMMMQMQNSGVYSGGAQQREIDRLNEELSLTKSKLGQLQDELSNLDLSASRNMKNVKDKMMKSEWEHKQEIMRLQQAHNQTVLELQSELTKHRNRTINLLAEKDNEIKGVQKLLQSNKPQEKRGRDLTQIDNENPDDQEDEDGDHGVGSNLTSCPLYQCCEVKARMNQELKKLRRGRRELMLHLHKLESDMEYARSDWSNEVGALKAKLQRAESINKLSTNINMEYLRNVLVRFLSTSDPSCRDLMAKAIGKVLQFSSEELSSLKGHSLK